MMKKRIASVVLSISLIACLFVNVVSAANNPFKDVSSSAYYHDAVIWALENGVTSGTSTTTFSPSDTCTRGQVVTFLWRSQGQPEPTTKKNAFSDVSATDYFYKSVLWAVEKGITNGTSSSTFSPEATCTKAQVLTFLWRTLDEPAASGTSAIAAKYSGQYYADAVAWADTNGMLSNMGSKAFNATNNCPRSDVVTYLYRFSTNGSATTVSTYTKLTPTSYTSFKASDVPAYTGSAFVKMNGNNPYFTLANLTTDSYEMYGDLDNLGRCTTCVACVGEDIMPTEERGSIGQVKPTGWHTVKYDCVDGKYLYNRSHLIGFQLTGENANTKNLITGTRYFNMNMLDYENLIAEYVEDYHAHVLYRVTPVFSGNNLLANGVLMEGMSVEDRGKSVKFCVFMYNVQPGIVLDYATGDSYESGTTSGQTQTTTQTTTTTSTTYILNTNTHKFHIPSCSSVKKMSESNKKEYIGTRDEIIKMGYDPCKNCNP